MIETGDDTVENRPVRWLAVAAGLLALSLACVTTPLARADSAASASRLFRFAFTSSMFTEVNEKDANAAIKVWMITGTSFEIMSELNPQVGRQLRVLAESPAFVPSAFGFRTDGMNSYREQMMAEIRELPNFPAGQQILTLLQGDRIEKQPVSCLDSAWNC